MAENSDPKSDSDSVVDAEIVESDDLPADEPAQAAQIDESPERTSGLPNLLVAFCALALGGGAVYFLQPAQVDNQAQIDALSAQIESLSQTISEPEPVAVSPQDVERLEGALSTELGDLGQSIGGLSEGLSTVMDRLQALEMQQPNAVPTDLNTAIESLRTDVSAWQEEASRLRAENVKLNDALAEKENENARLLAELNSVSEELEAAVAVTTEKQAIQISAVLSEIEAALALGLPFEAASDAYESVLSESLPAALRQVANSGVKSASELQESFAVAARDAISVDLAAGVDGPVLGRAADFLKAQLNLRSVAPREGDSADAVLSRSGAALQNGDFAKSIDELANLPQEAREQMADWTSDAQALVDAQLALDALKELHP